MKIRYLKCPRNRMDDRMDRRTAIYLDSTNNEEARFEIDRNYDVITAMFTDLKMKFVFFERVRQELIENNLVRFYAPSSDENDMYEVLENMTTRAYTMSLNDKFEIEPSIGIYTHSDKVSDVYLLFSAENLLHTLEEFKFIYGKDVLHWLTTNEAIKYAVRDDVNDYDLNSLLLDSNSWRHSISSDPDFSKYQYTRIRKEPGCKPDQICKSSGSSRYHNELVDSLQFDIVRSCDIPPVVPAAPAAVKADSLADENFAETTDTSDFLKDLKKKMEEKNIPVSYVISFLQKSQQQKLSRIVVHEDYSVSLPDFHNMKVDLPPMELAVYILFLSHPEGIYFKRLSEYRSQLASIYETISHRKQESVEKALDRVTDPEKNTINEKCSVIKNFFQKSFDDSIARYYYINGEKGGPKSIEIANKDMVEWE